MELRVLMIFILAILIVWDTIWKGIGMWHAAKHNQIKWFVCILVFNTVGILPIIYINFFQKKKKR